MVTKEAILTLTVRYEDDRTDADSICSALDILLETAMSSPGILSEYGAVEVEEFYNRGSYSIEDRPS